MKLIVILALFIRGFYKGFNQQRITYIKYYFHLFKLFIVV